MVAGTIRGHRSFGVSGDRLTPIVRDFVYWKPELNEATCIGGGIFARHEVATRDCTCGFYAYTDPTNPGEYYFEGTYGCPCNICQGVVGVIEAWGRVTVGTLGFRAQYARVIALGGPNLSKHPEIVERYQVPTFATQRDMLNAIPLKEGDAAC
jgi:hypothetical protein